MAAERPLLRAPALYPGDTIAFVAPASGLAALVPHRLTKAKQELERLGFKVKIYPSVARNPKENMEILLQSHQQGQLITTSTFQLDPEIYGPTVSEACNYSSADAIMRANELMQAFRDPEVKAIVCTIGGLTSHELLEYLDFDSIRDNPKIFSGISDITTLHLALYTKCRLCTFYGPSAVCQFGEFPAPLSYTMEHFWKAVQQNEQPIGAIEASKEWTDDKTANWLTRADINYEDKMQPNKGYQWLRPGSATGRILGGCLPVLLNVRGTEYMPPLDDAILLLETPESDEHFDKGMSLDLVNSVLGCLRVDGTFHKIKGLVVGRAFAYTEEQVVELQRLIKYHTRGTNFPIVYGVDCGHTNPIATIPLGCVATLDSSINSFAIIECGVV